MRRLPLAVAIGLGLGLIAISPNLDAALGAQSASLAVAASPQMRVEPLRLTLTQADVQNIVARYRMETGDLTGRELEEITVTAPAERLPMRDETRDVWEGIAAPFWALLHPAQAWRIFLPILPE